MDVAVLVARLLLAAVFAVAGASKLLDRRGSRQGMIEFGVPERLAGPVGLLLPLAELAVAAALVPRTTTWWGAVGALVLLAVFLAGIAFNLARGRKPDCRCFGQLHSEPIGWPTVGRNLALAAVAGFLISQGRVPPVLGLGSLGGATVNPTLVLAFAILAMALLIAESWLLLQMLRQNGRLLVRIEALEEKVDAGGSFSRSAELASSAPRPGLPIGSMAPSFSLPGLRGETLTLDYLRASELPVVLFFMDPNCGPCNGLMPEVGRWQREQAERVTLAIVSRGSAEANKGKVVEHGVTNVLLQQDYEVADAYKAHGTPAAVLVRPDGTIGSHAALGPEEIRALVEALLEQSGDGPIELPVVVPGGNGSVHHPPLPVAAVEGDEAPAIALPDLDGTTVSLADWRGSRMLVLFWNPQCGFCQQMLPDLKAWEANPPADAPKVFVVSTGSIESNRGQGIRSTMVIDESFSAGPAYGAHGTPMAVLVDAEGKIASQVAAGAPEVFALANGEPLPERAVQSSPELGSLKIGDAVPEIELEDLNGQKRKVGPVDDSPTVVLFWNPGCGFCQQMLPDLKKWEKSPPKGSPRMLVVSTGSVESNRAQNLRSPLVLDLAFSVGSAFGANGTPMAVLIDGQGRVASELAMGAEAVFELAKPGGRVKREG
jgi:thiol-disulfide isomerase/thioredoxin/uncharacterized membrane protein YphA (DoxX/SURF4 family)